MRKTRSVEWNWRLFWWMFGCFILAFSAFYFDWTQKLTFSREKKFIESRDYILYYVKEGDTLWSIASWAMDKGYMDKNLDIRENIYFIEIKNPYITKCLMAGDVLKIPITCQEREVKNAAR